MCMENTTKKLYFLKYFYTGVSVWTTVCMVWFFPPKYNWKLSAVLGTVIKCPYGTGSTWEKTQWKVVFFTSNIFTVCYMNMYIVFYTKVKVKSYQKLSPLFYNLFLLYVPNSTETRVLKNETIACSYIWQDLQMALGEKFLRRTGEGATLNMSSHDSFIVYDQNHYQNRNRNTIAAHFTGMTSFCAFSS